MRRIIDRNPWNWIDLQVYYETRNMFTNRIGNERRGFNDRLLLEAVDLSVKPAQVQFVVLIDAEGGNIEVSLHQ